MTIRELVTKNRSCRRFRQESAVGRQTLEQFVDLARLSASAANLQPLKYILSCKPETNALILPHLAWAGYLEDWPGPAEGERPAAYIIILGDTAITKSFGCDHGIAAQSILLGATETGLAGCMIALIERRALRAALKIPAQYEILLAIALGSPKEQIVLEDVGPDGDIRYYHDNAGVHHVPKRARKDIILDLP
jgi:nitroreductase